MGCRFLFYCDMELHDNDLEGYINDCLENKGGYKFYKAKSRVDALEIYRGQSYDIVFLNINTTNNIGGIEIAKKIFDIEKSENNYFIIKKNNQEIRIMYRDVLYFEKIANYIEIFMENQKNERVRMTFKELEKVIDMNIYIRCHSGFIVNKSKIKSLTAKEIEIFNLDKKIPIGRVYKKSVSKYFHKE